MTTHNELIDEIGKTLGGSISTSQASGLDPSDVYEAYLLSRVIEAAKLEGAVVRYGSASGKAPTHFVFRTSPGHIYSSAKNYTHATLSFPNCPDLEVHLGIRIRGKSGVLHEADVAVVERDEAIYCRKVNVDPRSRRVIVAIEAKYYVTHLSLSLARSYLGLVSDLSCKEPIFVTNTSSASVSRLLAARGKNWEDDVLPDSSGSVRAVAFFVSVFHRFKARFS